MVVDFKPMEKNETCFVKKTHVFQSEGRTYLFDDKTGIVLQVPENDRDSIIDILEKAQNPDDLIELIDKKLEISKNPEYIHLLKEICINFGSFFRKVNPELPLPSQQEIKEWILRGGLFELFLETTTECNFRCKYCVYSGAYEGFRPHETCNMSSHIARKSIDMYFKYLNEGKLYNFVREPTICFYGGEPLLNFDLIKKVVNYVKKIYSKEYKCAFTLTTNGSLLGNTEIIDFLLLNNISTFVSLDGPKEVHDQNRVFADGSKTFDIVVENIKKFKERAETLGIDKSKVCIFALAVYDSKTDIRKVKEFFDEDPPLSLIFVNSVRPYGSDYYSQFSQAELEKFYIMHDELEKEFFNYISNKSYHYKPNSFFDAFFGFNLSLGYHRPLLMRENHPSIPYTKSCFPGFKIFVDVHGRLYPCERVSSQFQIGHVDKGLDYELIKEILQKYQKNVLEKKCTECSIAYNCGGCFATLGFEVKDEICSQEQFSTFKTLDSAMQAYRIDPEYFEKIAKDTSKHWLKFK